MILPDLDLKLGPWHAECFAFFTAYNREKVWDNYEDMVKIQREEPDGFVKVVTILLKAVRARKKTPALPTVTIDILDLKENSRPRPKIKTKLN